MAWLSRNETCLLTWSTESTVRLRLLPVGVPRSCRDPAPARQHPAIQPPHPALGCLRPRLHQNLWRVRWAGRGGAGRGRVVCATGWCGGGVWPRRCVEATGITCLLHLACCLFLGAETWPVTVYLPCRGVPCSPAGADGAAAGPAGHQRCRHPGGQRRQQRGFECSVLWPRAKPGG